jgi:hypothetical protein
MKIYPYDKKEKENQPQNELKIYSAGEGMLSCPYFPTSVANVLLMCC